MPFSQSSYHPTMLLVLAILLPVVLSAPLTPRQNGSGSVKYAGVNIAGFDFGCDTTGTCSAIQSWPPLTQYGGQDGVGQMNHFVDDDGFNAFRLPVAWHWLTNDQPTATLDENNLAEYDTLVQACIDSGAEQCIIDIHNYARFNGAIIGQGGPSNDIFASLWGNIATKYATTSQVAFGVMNEPHDVPDINAWADSVQAAVTAIRNAGATSQLILLPGNDYTSAGSFISDGSAAALSTVTNPDGSLDGLIFDVHKYLDSDNSGTNAECTTDNVADAFSPLADYLRENNRTAWLTETGGGNTDSCVQYMCQQVDFLNQNSDVYLGYVGWAAGNFNATSYVLSEVPTQSGNTWTDAELVSSCLAPSTAG